MGLQRACVQYKKVKGGVFRCKKFQEGRRYPSCPPGPKKNLRSAWAIHKGNCGKVAAPKRKSKSKR